MLSLSKVGVRCVSFSFSLSEQGLARSVDFRSFELSDKLVLGCGIQPEPDFKVFRERAIGLLGGRLSAYDTHLYFPLRNRIRPALTIPHFVITLPFPCAIELE